MSAGAPAPEVFAWHLTTGTLTRDEARKIVFSFDPLPNGQGSAPLDPGGAKTPSEPA